MSPALEANTGRGSSHFPVSSTSWKRIPITCLTYDTVLLAVHFNPIHLGLAMFTLGKPLELLVDVVEED